METKFNLKQLVWVVWDNKVQEGVIDKIVCSVNQGTSYFIHVEKNEFPITFAEEKLFATKEELIKSL